MISKTIIENVLIIAAEGFWLSSNSSQLRRLIKTRNPKGLSAPSITLNAAGNIAWATYFTSLHLWVPVVTNLTMMIITITTLGYLLRNKKQFIRGIVSIALLGPLTSYLLITFTSIAGWVGMAYNTTAAAPWVMRVVSLKKVSGISEKSLFFTLGANLCTLTYALLISSAPLTVSCLLGLSYWLIIVRYYYRYRKTD